MWDDRKLRQKLARLAAVSAQLPRMAATAEGEALGHAVISANRSVYQTTPGAYQRTQDYLRGFHTSSRGTKHTASVAVWNDVDYAGVVESGQGPNEMTPAQVLAYLQARSNPAAPLYFGRTGERYTLPGPAVLPAAFYAGWRLKDLFGKAVGEAMR